MNKRTIIRWLLNAALATLVCSTAVAQERGTKDEALAMVNDAVEYVAKVGPEVAFKEFTDRTNKRWQNKDLYLYVYTMKGDCLAHGANEKLVGKNLYEIKDPSGKLIIQEIIKTVSGPQGSGWIEFDWAHPQTKKIEDKISFNRKMKNVDGFIGTGIYPQ